MEKKAALSPVPKALGVVFSILTGSAPRPERVWRSPRFDARATVEQFVRRARDEGDAG